MFKLNKILADNNISHSDVAYILNMRPQYFDSALYKFRDFTINQLQVIKNYLVTKNVINDDFDIGEFLEEVGK